MNEEEKEAIEILNKWLCKTHSEFCKVGAVGIPNEEFFATEILLNLIEKQNSIIKNAIDYIQHNNKELKNYSEQEMLDWLYGLDKCCEIKEDK